MNTFCKCARKHRWLLAVVGMLSFAVASAADAQDSTPSTPGQSKNAEQRQQQLEYRTPALNDRAAPQITQKRLEEAQRRLDQAAHEVAEISMSLAEERGGPFTLRARGRNRGYLGLVFTLTDDGPNADGVKVASVTPGGAADAAGLRAGDTLLDINGEALRRTAESGGHERLMSVTREIKPGEKVALSYRRDGRVTKVELVAKAPSFDSAMTMPGLALQPFAMHRGFWGGAEGAFGSTELVTLTPKLGQYFGSDKGLLVVRAPQDSRLKLEEGDVILDVDGRVPTSPAHAFKILGSYQAGEKVKLNVLRMKKHSSIEVTIPPDTPRATAEPGRPMPVAIPVIPDTPAFPGPPPPDHGR